MEILFWLLVLAMLCLAFLLVFHAEVIFFLTFRKLTDEEAKAWGIQNVDDDNTGQRLMIERSAVASVVPGTTFPAFYRKRVVRPGFILEEVDSYYVGWEKYNSMPRKFH